jgi:hypothetical protein
MPVSGVPFFSRDQNLMGHEDNITGTIFKLPVSLKAIFDIFQQYSKSRGIVEL